MIAIGGSLGAIRAVQTILQGMPAGFSRPIAIVLHRHKDSVLLRETLQAHCKLPVIEITDKEPIEAGHVYLGPADYHVLAESNCFSLSVDEPIRYSRPSIDLFFESIARNFGTSATAVVLTGANADGALGAEAVKLHGGVLIVQDPQSAESPIMPRAAAHRAHADYVLTVEAMAGTLAQLSNS